MAQGDITASGTITANSTSSTAPAAGSTVTIGAADVATVGIQLTGTWVGTLIAEGNETGLSTDWVAAPMTTLAGAPTVGLTGNGIYTVNAAPFMLFRLRSTAWTSGTANVLLHGAISGMGGGTGGGGGASTIADGANVVEGSVADAAVQGDNAGTISAKLRGLNKSIAAGIPISSLPALPTGANVIGAVTQSGTWNVTVNTALPAGANAIGTVGVTSLPALSTGANTIGAVTQSGTWNVTVNAALPTGANVIGAVTQSGTWNVTVNAALPAGANAIGTVGVTSLPALPTGANVIGAVTQSGTWNVTVNAALPTGANVIGAVTQSGTWNVTVNAALPTGANTIGAVTQASGPWTVQGAGAAGAGVTGSPVRVGISDLTNTQDVMTANAASANAGAGLLGAGTLIYDAVNSLWRRAAVSGAAASTATTSTLVPISGPACMDSAGNYLPIGTPRLNTDGISAPNCMSVHAHDWNGTLIDRHRNNVNAVVRTSTGVTVQTINTDITTYNANAFLYHANVTNYNGGTLNVTLQWKDANGLFVTIPGATTGTLSAGADIILAVGNTTWPANTATAFYVNWHLPRLIRIVEVIATATVTFAAAYDLHAS